MIKMNIEECLREGYLKKIQPDKEMIKKEIAESEKDLKRAELSAEEQSFKWSIIQAYCSMFHAARSVLISQGLLERRHFAIEVVLQKLVREGKLESYYLEDFKAAMSAREDADYSSVYSKERADQMLTTAEEFLERVKKFF